MKMITRLLNNCHQYIRFTLIISLFVPCLTFSKDSHILNDLEKDILSIIDNVKPSVVTISANYNLNLVDKESSFLNLSDGSQENLPLEMENIGSGIAIDSTHIITLASIVQGSQDIKVETFDGRTQPGTLIGIEAEYGLAIIKTENLKFQPAKATERNHLRSGCFVIVIGNSLGVTPAVSFGMVNAIRSDGIIQMSTNVAAGSVGGPIFDTDGNLVGILAARILPPDNNVMYNAPFLSNEGALAYPLDKVKQRVNQIIYQNSGQQGWIGVTGDNWPGKDGWVHVSNVKKGSPAHKAGLKMGDIICTLDDKNVGGAYKLASEIKGHQAGSKIKFGILRGNEKHVMNIEIGQPDPVTEKEAYTQDAFPASEGAQNPGTIETATHYSSESPQIDQQILLYRIKNMEQELKALRSAIKK